MNTSLTYPTPVAGSLQAQATAHNKSLAETFIGADCVVLVDTSGSMSCEDSRGRRSRYEVACEELAQLQANLPGKIAVLSFSHDTLFCPSGVPQYMGGGTNLAGALKFAKVADVPDMRFIVISDGEPDDEGEALGAARTYRNRIDAIYVGPEDHPSGRGFLQRLAQASGGQTVTADRAQELAAATQRLLLTA
ncbi:MAG: vWA domain-containing protein [Chloroflexota bacterium]